MKYIMFETKIGGITKKIPIIFPDFMVHKEVKNMINRILERQWKDIKAVNAGEINIPSGCCPFGKSETLNLYSSPDDGKIIDEYDYYHGIL